MRLAADASSVVAEGLRRRRDQIIGHGDVILYIAEPTRSEVVHDLGRRLDAMLVHGHLSLERHRVLLTETVRLLAFRITIAPADEYREYEAVARARVPRDPNDWPTVALALMLDTGIWTSDYDFFGCGVPVWTTETLITQLDT